MISRWSARAARAEHPKPSVFLRKNHDPAKLFFVVGAPFAYQKPSKTNKISTFPCQNQWNINMSSPKPTKTNEILTCSLSPSSVSLCLSLPLSLLPIKNLPKPMKYQHVHAKTNGILTFPLQNQPKPMKY